MGKGTGYSAIFNISYPIFLSLLAQNLIIVVDTAFLGRLGEVELGAGAIGGLMYVCLYIIGFGFGTGSQIIIGRRNGEKRFAEIGKVLDHSLYFLILLAVVLFLGMKSMSGILLKSIISSENILTAAGAYLDVRVWGLLFAYINISFRAFYIGIARTSLLTYSAIMMAVVNIGMDYVLIFGKFGFPEMGIAGAALASVLAEATSAVFFITVTVMKHKLRIFALFRFPFPDPAILKTIFGVSVYIMIQYFISVFSWFMFFVIIERTGERPLAVSNIIRSLYMIFTIPIWALGATTSTLVSNTLGEKKIHDVIPLVRKISAISLLSMTAVVGLVWLFASQLISFYTTDPGLISDSVKTLFIVLGVFLLFSLTIIGFNAVSGTANTRTSLSIEILSIIFYLCVSWLLAVELAAPVHIIWLAEYVYVFILGSLSFLYLWKGKWMNKEV